MPGAKGKGAREAVADYLRTEVGEGGVFRISDLRKIDTAEQIGRRMRQLRDYGWVIRSHLSDPSLKSGEYRFVKEGDGVLRKKPVSGKLRRQVFERDHYTCRLCGFARGDIYPDRPDEVKLTVGHIIPQEHDGPTELSNLRTECKRCNEEARDQTPTTDSLAAILTQVKNLKRSEKQQLASWLGDGARKQAQVDIIWAKLAVMPQEASAAVIDELNPFMK